MPLDSTYPTRARIAVHFQKITKNIWYGIPLGAINHCPRNTGSHVGLNGSDAGVFRGPETIHLLIPVSGVSFVTHTHHHVGLVSENKYIP